MHAHALCRKKLPAEMLCRARGATLPRIGHMHRTHDMHQALRCSQNALAGFAGAAAAHQAGGRRGRPGFAAEPHTPPESAGRCARGAGRTAGEATKCLLHESVLCTATGPVPCACIRVLQRDMILKAYSTKASAQAKAAVVPLVQIMQDSPEDASKSKSRELKNWFAAVTLPTASCCRTSVHKTMQLCTRLSLVQVHMHTQSRASTAQPDSLRLL